MRSISLIRWLALLTGALIVAAFPIYKAITAPPSLIGTLVFHRYTSYDAWDGELLTLDLQTKELTNLTSSWRTVKHTINGHFSSDGQHIVFMGSLRDRNDWDIFVSKWSQSDHRWQEPVNLTGPNGKRDEDPKFSPLKPTIIYKEDGDIAMIDVSGGPISYFTTGEDESSMPYFLPNGKDFVFERTGDIYLRTFESNNDFNEVRMFSGDGRSSYYPIVIDNDHFLYSRVQNSRHDWVMVGNFSGAPSRSLFFNSTQWDSSDAYPYMDGANFVFYVSGDYLVPKGGYNLMLADLNKEKSFDIDSLFADVNTDLEELGPAWSPYLYPLH